MQARSFIVATWVLQAVVWPASIDPQQALEQSIDAERENLKRAAAWVFDEKITYTQISNSGKRKETGSVEYEVIALEGRPYYKLVKRNGKKLGKKEREEEEERMERVALERRAGFVRSDRPRLSIPFSELAEEHVAVWDDEVLRTSPRLPGLRRISDLITTEQWLDPQTMLRRKAVVHFLEAEGTNPENTAITFEFKAMPDGTSLAHRIFYRRPYGEGWHETEQIYSNYRKFDAVSTIKSAEEIK